MRLLFFVSFILHLLSPWVEPSGSCPRECVARPTSTAWLVGRPGGSGGLGGCLAHGMSFRFGSRAEEARVAVRRLGDEPSGYVQAGYQR